MANFLEMIIKAAIGPLVRVVDVYQRNMKKNMFLKSRVVKEIKKSIKAWFGSLKKKPSKKSDYVLLGDSYYSKRMMMVLTLLIILIMALGNTVLMPLVRGRLYTPTIAMSDPLLATYSGKVKMINREKVLTYNGVMVQGKCSGFGRQYDDSGKLVYEGDFLNDFYQGKGTQFNDQEKPLYEGGFQNNLYHGLGKYYNADGQMIYEGEFANGYYEGTGKLYSAEGALIYSGKFSLGLQNGYGVTYDDKGLIQYSGDFVNGVFDGDGTLLSSNGKKLYSGHFASGQYDGMGKQFSKSGKLQYEGTFSLGQYNGIGKLYSETGILIYEGNFAQGQYSGIGKLYNPESGLIQYSGNFDKGLFHGTGVYYTDQEKRYEGDWVSGTIVYENLLNQLSTVFRTFFFEPGQMIEMKSSYALNLPKTGIVAIFNYPDEVLEPMIQKIIVLNDEIAGMNFNTLTLESAKALYEPATISVQPVSLNKLQDSEVYKAITKATSCQVLTVSKEGFNQNYYFDGTAGTLLFIEFVVGVETP